MGEMCRLCLSEKDVLIPIFYHGSVLPENIQVCLAVQVSSGDSHKHICIACDGKLRQWWSFKLEIQSAQKFLNSNLSKTLHSRTVTSSGENFAEDPCKSSIAKFDSGIRVKNCHSLSAEEFGNDQSFSSGATAVVIKREGERNSSRSNSSSSRGSVQVMPVSAAMDSHSGSQVDVSSSSGERVGSVRRASRSSTQSSVQNENQNYDSDDCLVVDGPKKRKCEVVTLDKPEPKKRQKLNSGSAKQKKVTKVSSESSKSKASTSKENVQESERSVGIVKILGDNSKVSAPVKVGRQYIPCPYCSSTLQVYSLPTHIISVHKMDPSADDLETYIESQLSKTSNPKGKPSLSMKITVFPCNLCKNSYKTPLALKQHKKKFHPNVPGSSSGSGLLKKSRCICDRCKRQLNSATAVTFHKQYCGTERAVVCPFCSQCFETVIRLRRHIGQKHSDDSQVSSLSLQELEKLSTVQPVPRSGAHENKSQPPSRWKLRPNCPRCEQCTRLFMKEGKLAEHQKYCGTFKAFKCHLCPQQFMSGRSVTNHSMAAHNKVLYPCDFCSKKLASKVEFDEHTKMHRQMIKSKLYHKCRSCQKVFHGIAAWKSHKADCKRLSIHKCGKCSFRFKDADLFSAHQKGCTGKAPIEEKLNLASKNIRCLQCMQKFDSEMNFVNHFVTSHVNAANSIYSGVNSFDCNFCYWAANNASSVSKHDSRCNGISFYLSKSPVENQASPSKIKNLSSSQSEQNNQVKKLGQASNSKSGAAKSSTLNTKKPTAPIEIGKICSPAFMNEHLNASKNAQVIVEKLSDKEIHSASISDKKPLNVTPVEKRMTPSSKVNCEYCKRFFTPKGIVFHNCSKKKKMRAREYKERSKERAILKKLVSSNAEPTIKCELCNETFTHKALPEHLRVRHLAIKPVDMAESMIELSMMKLSLTAATVKDESVEVENDEDSNGGASPSDRTDFNSSPSLEAEGSTPPEDTVRVKSEEDSDAEKDNENENNNDKENEDEKEEESHNISSSLTGEDEEEEEEEMEADVQEETEANAEEDLEAEVEEEMDAEVEAEMDADVEAEMDAEVEDEDEEEEGDLDDDDDDNDNDNDDVDNENDNENDNGNDNGNDNESDNGNDNENDNGNDNENDNGNDNENDMEEVNDNDMEEVNEEETQDEDVAEPADPLTSQSDSDKNRTNHSAESKDPSSVVVLYNAIDNFNSINEDSSPASSQSPPRDDGNENSIDKSPTHLDSDITAPSPPTFIKSSKPNSLVSNSSDHSDHPKPDETKVEKPSNTSKSNPIS